MEVAMATLDRPVMRPVMVTSGWVVYAATMATVAGMFNLIYGIVLLFNDTWVGLTTEGILVFDLTAWGWILLGLGTVQLVISFGITSGQSWARVVGVLWASLIAIGQMAFLNVYPIWSLIIITMSLLVIYGLTVHGETKWSEETY
jgi:hypothetical protein